MLNVLKCFGVNNLNIKVELQMDKLFERKRGRNNLIEDTILEMNVNSPFQVWNITKP